MMDNNVWTDVVGQSCCEACGMPLVLLSPKQCTSRPRCCVPL